MILYFKPYQNNNDDSAASEAKLESDAKLEAFMESQVKLYETLAPRVKDFRMYCGFKAYDATFGSEDKVKKFLNKWNEMDNVEVGYLIKDNWLNVVVREKEEDALLYPHPEILCRYNLKEW